MLANYAFETEAIAGVAALVSAMVAVEADAEGGCPRGYVVYGTRDGRWQVVGVNVGLTRTPRPCQGALS